MLPPSFKTLPAFGGSQTLPVAGLFDYFARADGYESAKDAQVKAAIDFAHKYGYAVPETPGAAPNVPVVPDKPINGGAKGDVISADNGDKAQGPSWGAIGGLVFAVWIIARMRG